MNASTLGNLQVERVVAREFATVTSLLRIHWQFLSPGNYSVIASNLLGRLAPFLWISGATFLYFYCTLLTHDLCTRHESEAQFDAKCHGDLWQPRSFLLVANL